MVKGESNPVVVFARLVEFINALMLVTNSTNRLLVLKRAQSDRPVFAKQVALFAHEESSRLGVGNFGSRILPA